MVLQLFSAMLGVTMGIYVRITENYDLLPFMLIFLSGMLILMGLREYKRSKNLLWSIFIFCIACFILFSAVQGMIERKSGSMLFKREHYQLQDSYFLIIDPMIYGLIGFLGVVSLILVIVLKRRRKKRLRRI